MIDGQFTDALLAIPSETALALANILLSQDVELSLRQICAQEYLEAVGPDCNSFHSAGIILRKYVNERWSPYFKAFKGNAPPVEVSRTYASSKLYSLRSRSNHKSENMCLKASPIPIERSDLLLCALHVLYFSLSSLNFRLIPCLSSQTATGLMSIPTSLTISLPYSLRLPWTLFMALCKFLTNLSNPTSARTKSFQY